MAPWLPLIGLVVAASIGAPIVRAGEPNPLRYKFAPRQTFGYSLVVAMKAGEETKYVAGLMLFAVAGITEKTGQLVSLASLRPMGELAQSGDLEAFAMDLGTNRYVPSALTVHFEKTSINRNFDDESLPHWLGDAKDWAFPPLPREVIASAYTVERWVIGMPFAQTTSISSARVQYRYETLPAAGPLAQIKFLRSLQSKEKVDHGPVDEMRGTGTAHFDRGSGLLTQAQFRGEHLRRSKYGDTSKVSISVVVARLAEQPLRRVLHHLSGQPATDKPHWTDGMLPLPATNRVVASSAELAPGSVVQIRSRGSWYLATVQGAQPDGKVIVESGAPGRSVRLATAVSGVQLPTAVSRKSTLTADAGPRELSPSERAKILAGLKSGSSERVSDSLTVLAERKPTGTDDEMADALLALLSEKNSLQCQAALSRLRDWGTPRCVPRLIDELQRADNSRTSMYRSQVAGTLTAFGPAVEPQVLPLLNSTNPEVVKAAIGILRDVGTARAVSALQRLATRSRGDSAVYGRIHGALLKLQQRYPETKPPTVSNSPANVSRSSASSSRSSRTASGIGRSKDKGKLSAAEGRKLKQEQLRRQQEMERRLKEARARQRKR